MPEILKHINKDLLREFKKSIPEIKKSQVAQRPWPPQSKAYGVGGNTFRAYSGLTGKPSHHFREWAESQIENLAAIEAEKISTQEKFDKWHQALADSLQKLWRKRECGKDLSVSHKYKLVDLFVKWLAEHKLPNEDVVKHLINFGHCALDRQTLEKINQHLGGAIPMSNPSMGLIATEATYEFCQNIIKEYCLAAGGTSLLFDFFAWKSGE